MSILTTTLVENYDPTVFDGFDGTGAFSDQGARVFRRRDARALAWAAQIAYEDDPRKVGPILARWGFQTFEIFDTPVGTTLPMSNTHGIVATSDRARATVIGFAGTDPLSLWNWVTDFNIAGTDRGSSAGFTRAAGDVLATILGLLAQRPIPYPVFVTGHSLGGALAAIAAFDLKTRHDIDVAAVVTTGAPRPGNAQFAEAYAPLLGDRTFRLVHGDDFVPTVPPGRIAVGGRPLQHVGLFVHCPRGETFDEVARPTPSILDPPAFSEAVARELKTALDQPLASLVSVGRRARIGLQFILRIGPVGRRSDIGAVAVELLPQNLQDHFGYLNALRP